MVWVLEWGEGEMVPLVMGLHVVWLFPKVPMALNRCCRAMERRESAESCILVEKKSVVLEW